MIAPRQVVGMSLLEMLVVMVISAMAVLLTTQAIGAYQRAQASAIYNERSGREFNLSEAWLRDSIRALHPVEDAAFRGETDRFTGLSLAPIVGPRGTPVQQTWETVTFADGSAGLRVLEDDADVPLVLRQARAVRFSYLDDDLTWHEQWPPALGVAPHLPRAIAMQIEHQDPNRSTTVLVAAVAGPREPLEMPFELELDW